MPLEHEQTFDDRKLIVRQLWFFPPVCFPEPPKYRQRFYDRIVDIGQKTWHIEGEEALFGGVCVVEYRLMIDYQPTVDYAERNFLSLDDLHKHLQERFSGPITAIVRRELKALSPELFAAGTGTDEVRASIEKGINDLLRRHEIRCQTSCALKSGAVEFPKEDDSTFILHKDVFRLITKAKHDYFEEERKQQLWHQERLREQKFASDQAERAFEEREREIEWEHTVSQAELERRAAEFHDKQAFETTLRQLERERRARELEWQHTRQMEDLARRASELEEQRDRIYQRSDVRFTAYYPDEIQTQGWNTLLFYAHVPKAQTAVEADGHKRLREESVEYAVTHSGRTASIVRGAEFTVVPRLKGCRFNPPVANVLWLEDLHCVEFRFRACVDNQEVREDTEASGVLSVYVGPVLIADLAFFVHVATSGQERKIAQPLRVSTAPYEAVFVSYSHEDSFIVDRLEKAYAVLGLDYVRDIRALRSGQNWNAELLKKIDLADVFQLCWSGNARKSPNVEREWRHALELSRKQFIRPLYWETPMPEPPSELAPIHFAYLHWT